MYISINRLARSLNWISIVIPRMVWGHVRSCLPRCKPCRKHARNMFRTYQKRIINMFKIYPTVVNICVNKCPEHIQHVSRIFQNMSNNHKSINWNSCHLLKLVSSVETVVICWKSCSLLKLLSSAESLVVVLFEWVFLFGLCGQWEPRDSCSLLKVM